MVMESKTPYVGDRLKLTYSSRFATEYEAFYGVSKQGFYEFIFIFELDTHQNSSETFWGFAHYGMKKQ